ncbi:efflux RND transporter periplasmic adaptor subunit [Pelobacter seleniigenes]|uniref:efflux RND transporter periplasmic adaptor subunit n=1 Tax=Pelobacter seleniigenes TaxID=407188 RepID=UPI0004A7483C|nr:efflux RND transporter periplasmic adaptor subunit [Pelobacter seleniigenes]
MRTYKRSRVALWFALICLLLVSGCDKKQDAAVPAVAAEQPVAKVIPVGVETVARENQEEAFTLPASLEAWEDLTIAAELAGPVEKVHYSEGDAVKAGDVLLEIDSDTINSNLVRDAENVAVAERKLERYQQLEKDGLVSRQDVDDLENSLAAARAAVQTTRIQLAKSKPKAPVNGIVDRIYVDRGEYIEMGKPLLRLVQVDRLKVIADVPEKDVSYLHLGQAVEVMTAGITAPDGQAIEGRIEHIAYAADDTTRTYRTKIVIANKDRRLRPGMIVRAVFVRRKLDDVISVPMYALIDRDGDKFVFVVTDGIAHEVKVTIGRSIADRIVIESGLEVGQQLVVKGQQLLVDGAAVVVRGE